MTTLKTNTRQILTTAQARELSKTSGLIAQALGMIEFCGACNFIHSLDGDLSPVDLCEGDRANLEAAADEIGISLNNACREIWQAQESAQIALDERPLEVLVMPQKDSNDFEYAYAEILWTFGGPNVRAFKRPRGRWIVEASWGSEYVQIEDEWDNIACAFNDLLACQCDC